MDAKRDTPNIILKSNNLISEEICPICGVEQTVASPLALCTEVDGRFEWVCDTCARQYAPILLDARNALNYNIRYYAEGQEMDKAKLEKLQHYASRDLTRFTQYDVGLHSSYDDMFPPDKDGDTLSGGRTDELMTGTYGVRVLITDGTSKTDALRALEKVRKWIEKDGVWKGVKPDPDALARWALENPGRRVPPHWDETV
jgi:hypothetical protein